MSYKITNELDELIKLQTIIRYWEECDE
jgi:hypothetical protein